MVVLMMVTFSSPRKVVVLETDLPGAELMLEKEDWKERLPEEKNGSEKGETSVCARDTEKEEEPVAVAITMEEQSDTCRTAYLAAPKRRNRRDC